MPTNEQKKFADANADGKMTWTKKSDPTPNDDLDVKADDYKKLVGTKSSYKLGEQETANLKQQVKEYVAKGGKLYSNQEVLNNPNQAIAGKNGIATSNANTPNVGETSSIIPLGNEPKTKFSVLLNNNGKPITNERVLTQFVQDRYQGGNLWGENYNQIANMSIAQGAKADNVNIKGNVGNKTAVYFDVSVKDQIKINENYKIVQSQVNEVEKIKAEIDRNNPVSQFILGAVDGVKDNLVGTATMIAHPLETLGAIKDVAVALGSLTAEDVGKIAEAVKSKIKDTFTTRDGINSIPYGAGYAVGMIATDIVIGKGVGIALEGVKEIPAIKNLLTKLGDLKSLTKAKIAEKFSDEAASLAGERARKALATTVYSGIPVDVLADMAVVAGNKISKGAVKFGEFSTQMVEKFGEKVKPYIEKLYREQMIELNLADKIDEVGIKSTNINKLSKAGVYTEKIKWGIQEIEVRPDGKGFWGKRTPQNNPRVDAFERKINPNNESYYVKSPKGGYVQFENISQSALQDGKLVMQADKSIYKVYDKPEFLRKKILDEATRQVEGAKYNGLKVEWLVSDKETVNQLTKFFKEKGVDILVKYLPE